MKHTELPQPLQNILKRISYATIATVCADGQPWNSPVYARIDADMHVYWVSWTENQHSQNIARDSRIFVVIYDSQVPEGEGLGIFMQMRAQPVLDPTRIEDIRHRLFRKDDDDLLLGDNPRRLYEAVPTRLWHNVDSTKNGRFIDRRKLIWQA